MSTEVAQDYTVARRPRLWFMCTPEEQAAIRTGVAREAHWLPTYLPERLRSFMQMVRLESPDVTVLSDLPLEPLPPTPEGWRACMGQGVWHEELLLWVTSALAQPFGWQRQQGGRLVHDICPSAQDANSLTSQSSTLPLALHTEDVFHPCRADYVALLCLRNPDATPTTIATLRPSDVPPDVAALLFEPQFEFLADDSHAMQTKASTVGAVFFGAADDPFLRFDYDFMRGLTDEATAAIGLAHDTMLAQIETVVLKPGDLVLLDNYRVVHGRAAFVPRYDGQDRWLKRVNLTRDLRRIAVHTGQASRII